MKIEVSLPKPSKPKKQFPVLAEWKKTSKTEVKVILIVLFTSESEGVVLESSDSFHRIGDHKIFASLDDKSLLHGYWETLPAGSKVTFTQE